MWLIVMQALFPGRKTVAELARWTPAHDSPSGDVAACSKRPTGTFIGSSTGGLIRLIPYRHLKMGTLDLGDGSDKPKRGPNPLAQKGRKSQYDPWFFGVRFALLIVSWDVFRLPVAFRLIRPKSHPKYQTENALFREMVGRFNPPAWAKVVIVEGDAAYGSQDNMKMVLQRDASGPGAWGFVFAIARTWKTVEGKAIKDLVTHLPRQYYRRTWVPRIPVGNGRQSFWVYSTRLCLRHVGDVTVVLSKTGRNVGPNQTKILVTNLTELTPRHMVFAYQKVGR